MKPSYLVGIVVFACVQYLSGQTKSCTSSSTSAPAANRFQLADTAEHASGSHSWGLTPVFGCVYAHGSSANCDTECKVTALGATTLDPLGGTLTTELGTLNAA